MNNNTDEENLKEKEKFPEKFANKIIDGKFI